MFPRAPFSDIQALKHEFPNLYIRALQWSGNPYGNGYGVEMDGNGAQFVKMLWIGLDLGKVISLKRFFFNLVRMFAWADSRDQSLH